MQLLSGLFGKSNNIVECKSETRSIKSKQEKNVHHSIQFISKIANKEHFICIHFPKHLLFEEVQLVFGQPQFSTKHK